ncbi:hypothetical protein FQR65_LT01686 [Abscondita terminalis]|nr:hypothetical protein FQR65_LT01686 [Abscondita terminalis]
MIAVKLLVINSLITFACSYKILGLFPFEGKSHYMTFEPLLRALAAKGHEVTVLSKSNFPKKIQMQNFKNIDISSEFPATGVIDLNLLTGSRFQKYATPILLAYFGYLSCSSGLSNKNFQDYINSDPEIDIIISEAFNTECFLGIVPKLKSPPLVLIQSCIMLPWQDDTLGMPSNPAYIPNHFLPFSNPYSFLERVENTVMYILNHIVFKLLIDIPGNIMARSYFGNDVPNINQVASNYSVFMVNSHFSTGGARPMVPGYIEVAGMHIETPKKLPTVRIFICAYKILGLFPYEGKSHYMTFEPLLRALAAKGHEVTVLSHFPQKNPLPNFKDVDISSEFETTNVVDLNLLTASRFQKYATPILLAYLGYLSCSSGLSNKNLQDYINSDPEIDIIISEVFNTECFLGIVPKLRSPPLVLIQSCMMLPWQDDTLGMPSNPAYIPNHFIAFSNPYSFLERVENTVIYVLHHLVFKLLIDIPGKIMARSYFGNDVPNLNEIASNYSVFLVNTHFNTAGARPMVPGYIEVAGMHIQKPKKLPTVRIFMFIF